MKKKIITICLAAIVTVMAIAGASLAYFTDTDSANNTFTVGNVTIDLIEQQRGMIDGKDGEKEEALVDFVQNKKLLPIVGSAQGEKDKFGLPTAANYVDKIVTIKNTGSEAAYIRAYFAIPSALDDGYDTFNAGLNVLHFNFGNKLKADGTIEHTTYQNEWLWKQANGKWNYFETTIDGISYNVYFADYATTVAAGATTEQFLLGVYLDKSFDSEVVTENGKSVTKYFVMQNGAKVYLDLDDAWSWSNVQCPVFAVAVQAQGFDSAADAINEAFGANYNPWGTTVTNWQ